MLELFGELSTLLSEAVGVDAGSVGAGWLAVEEESGFRVKCGRSGSSGGAVLALVLESLELLFESDDPEGESLDEEACLRTNVGLSDS